VKCDLISEGTEVQFPPQEKFSVRNRILRTGCVVNSASYLGEPFLRNNAFGTNAERSLLSG